MEDILLERNASVSLYHYMCQNITGYEDVVRTKRLLNVIFDMKLSNRFSVHITSGSFGEGLEMKGSDKDIMMTIHGSCVCTDLNDIHRFKYNNTLFTTIIDNTQPGFTLLKLIKCNAEPFLYECCVLFEDEYYLSSERFRNQFLQFSLAITNTNPTTCVTIHGPCITDKEESIDIARCLHSNNWLPSAQEWTTRHNVGWPDLELKSKIIEHGILFVPIGNKGSSIEDLEWRFSFSVGERMLIYSFRHTQLLCYAIMKLFLKDVLEFDPDCKGLLCSYHLKNVMFWISEEFPQSIWIPDNLITCFMTCLKRLVYFVRLGFFPHYFIPSNNLFKKIKDHQRCRLLKKLDYLVAMRWKCLFRLKQLSVYEILSQDISDMSKSKTKYCLDILKSTILQQNIDGSLWGDRNFKLSLYKVLYCKSFRVKAHLKLFLSFTSKKADEKDNCLHQCKNKDIYRQHKTTMTYALLNVLKGTMSEWLTLASYLYKMKQYHSALHVLSYYLSFEANSTYFLQFDLRTNVMDSSALQHKGLVFMLRVKYNGFGRFYPSRFSLLPAELDLSDEIFGIHIPPLVFAHFLCFLCHYRQQNDLLTLNSYENICRAIRKGISDRNTTMNQTTIMAILLGRAAHILGFIEKAREGYLLALESDYEFKWYNMWINRLLSKLAS